MVPSEWLTERVSVDEVEVDYLRLKVARPEGGAAGAEATGLVNQNWNDMKAALQPGDELWAFSTPIDYWRNIAGRAGIALVRDGHVVSSLTAMMT